MLFKDRNEAADLLIAHLQDYRGKNAIVLAIPRGGVPLGYMIALNLKLPLDVILSKKIGHPLQKEFAIGAVTLKSQVIDNSAAEFYPSYIEEEIKNVRNDLSKKYNEYYGSKPPPDLRGKILIIVDDGVATGNTLLSTIEMLWDEKPEKIVVAVPVSSKSALKKLEENPFITEVIYIYTPNEFLAVGQFYKNFDQVKDSEVNRLLNIETVAEL